MWNYQHSFISCVLFRDTTNKVLFFSHGFKVLNLTSVKETKHQQRRAPCKDELSPRVSTPRNAKIRVSAEFKSIM